MTLLRYEPWWRMPDAPKRSRGRRRLSGAALSFAGYWVVALAAAYAVHAEWLPARRWLVASTSTSVTAPRARIGRTIQVPVTDVPMTDVPVPDPVAPPPPFVPENEPDPYVAAVPEPEREPEPEAALTPAPRVERKRDVRRSSRRKEATRQPEPRVKGEKAPIIAERAPEPPNPIEPPPKPKREPAPKRAARPSSGGGTSCEAAIGSYRESIRIGDRSTPADISEARYAAVLNRGTYFQHCGVPDSTSIRICAAVQHGRAVGVTVSTNPPSGAVQRCIANAVRGLSFPSHPRMDVTTTVFE